MHKERLYIVSRESVVEARRMLEKDHEGAVLLVGRGLLLPADLFGKRDIYAIEEEVNKFGMQGKLSDNVRVCSAGDVVDVILDRQVVNFS